MTTAALAVRARLSGAPHLLLAFLCFAGLGSVARATETLVVDGVERRYELFVPAKAEASPALVIALHPRPASGAAMRFITGFDTVADAHGFVVAYPDGLGRTWNGVTCCGQADDVGFIVALVDHLKATRKVDPRRIYVAGVSNGAEMAFRLIGEKPGLFAAAGVVSGGRTGQRSDNGARIESPLPAEPIPLISLIGAQDQRASDFEQGLQGWQRAFGCKMVTRPAPDLAAQLSLGACRNGAELVSYRFEKVGHVWPGARDSGPLSWPDAPLSATQRLWEFFRSQRRPDATPR